MNQLSPEAKALRHRLSEYLRPSEQDLANIVPIEFAFKQLLDAILSSRPLDEPTLKAIDHLEESLEWAKKSVKRSTQIEVTQIDLPQMPKSLGDLSLSFEAVTRTMFNRCHTNRELKAAITRLLDAQKILQSGQCLLGSQSLN
jgi:hypothetical protein